MFADYSDGRNNNFDFIRFLAASIVIVSHSFLISWGNEKLEPLSILTGSQINSGELGVYIFFIISGFLIAQSYDRKPKLVPFLKARILRIFPGLAVVLLFTVFIVGGIVNWVHFSAYFSNPKIYTYLYNIDLYSIPFNQFHLGLFWRNAFGVESNGSLWTLYYEFVCYLVVAALGFTRTLRKPFVLGLFILGYAMAFHPFPGDPRLATTFYFLRFFSTGMLFYAFRKYIPHKWYIAALALVVLVASVPLTQIYNIIPLPLGYLIFYVAFLPKLRFNNFAKYGDFSYGLYIYAFPIQQLVTWYHGGKMHAHTNFLISFPITLVLAFLSWHFVEKRALRLKNKSFSQSSMLVSSVANQSRSN